MKARRSTAPAKIFQTQERALEITLRDVKNEDRTGYMHENKGEGTKCTPQETAFLRENALIAR